VASLPPEAVPSSDCDDRLRERFLGAASIDPSNAVPSILAKSKRLRKRFTKRVVPQFEISGSRFL
jgi:hypothetical protein